MRKYTIEATKITLFCLFITGLFKLFGASNKDLLIIFNIAVMSFAATFSVEKKHFSLIALGSFVIVFSIIAGGLTGYYAIGQAAPLTILYAGLAFYLPKTKVLTNILVTGSVMFLIFTTLPFNWKDGLNYSLDGIIFITFFVLYHWAFGYQKYIKPKSSSTNQISKDNHLTAGIAVLSLGLAWIIAHYLQNHTSITHLYWIGFTALVVIQSSQQKTIQTALKRILVNALGAVIIVILFNGIMPPDFLINFLLLVVFLFLIFFLSFTYAGRTLFIEMFVLGFAHLLGDYQNTIAFDRVFLTLIGGVIVILVTPTCFLLAHRKF